MVQLMRHGKPEPHGEKMAAVKNEIEDPLEEEHGSLLKRQKQQSLEVGVSLFNPLDEPSPLGLRLRKSPSLLELIQMKLSQSSTSKAGGHSHGKKESKGSGASGDKLKASNFPASVLRIGTWEYKSRYEGDLVAKCYFAKHKLVWEVLDGGLKNKIEIQWSDIMALKANYPDDSPGTLDVVLARQPLFFRETNPQPRKHTLWQATSDFTGEQASINRRHYLECPQGLLGKHFEKLTQCDPRLYCLSQQGEIILDSPFFEPRLPVLDDQNENSYEFDLNGEGSPSLFSLQETASPSGAQSPSKNDQDFHGKHTDFFRHETPSPSSVVYPAREVLTIEDIKSGGIEQLKALGGTLDEVRVHGLHSSMSMSDLVSHLEQRVSEQASLSNEDWESLKILDDINRCLFSDIQEMPDSDEKLLMSRVNSLCCLVQKDGSVMHSKSEICVPVEKGGASTSMYESDEMSDQNQGQGMSRKDSMGDLLLNLPRIASLPQFLFNIPGDYENKAR